MDFQIVDDAGLTADQINRRELFRTEYIYLCQKYSVEILACCCDRSPFLLDVESGKYLSAPFEPEVVK